MQMVVSQTWTLDDDDHADAYVAKSSAFEPFYRAQPGYMSRALVRGIEDRTHFMHLRVFATVEAYVAMTEIDEYQRHIQDLSQHVDTVRMAGAYPREFADVVFSS